MGRIHVLSEHVANKIAAGEMVERPASVVKELLENALDAGATRIHILIEGGGKKLIQITDNGCGMVRDDALLAFERHATSKMKEAEDLLTIATLGFRGEALPSIASVCRLHLETRVADQSSGTIVEMNGGKIAKVEEGGLPVGTLIAIRDLFFNTPARKKFLKAESTELSHIASLVTQYALAHPDKHFELHSPSSALLVAPPVEGHKERVYQVFGREVLEQLIPLSGRQRFERTGLQQVPRWSSPGPEAPAPDAGEMGLHGFVSRPEVQKLNRNSIYVFVNGRLVRDRLIQHALTDAYRNVMPAGVFPVVLLFLELPSVEVDVNVHPSKTEVRFRQPGMVHEFVRDSVRATLMEARPVPSFAAEIHAHPTASASLTLDRSAAFSRFQLSRNPAGPAGLPPGSPAAPSASLRLDFPAGPHTAAGVSGPGEQVWSGSEFVADELCAPPLAPEIEAATAAFGPDLPSSLATLKPLGQIRESFILAVSREGLWIVDQHVAHERVLFEKILKQRARRATESQRLLMPLLLELTPAQQTVFALLADELAANGFEAEPFGNRSIAIKMSPAALQPSQVEPMLQELLEQCSRPEQMLNMEKVGNRIAASIACHAAIKVNMPLEQTKMEWLLSELARTECPISCPHGRPIILRYSIEDIRRAFKRI